MLLDRLHRVSELPHIKASKIHGAYREYHKVYGHYHDGDHPGERPDDDAHKTSSQATKRHEPSDECEPTSNRVQYERIGERIDRVRFEDVETSAINLAHDHCRLVAYRFGIAVILIRGDGSDIENTVAEAAEGNRRVTDITLVGLHRVSGSFVGEEDLKLTSITLRMPMSPTTGLDIVVTSSRRADTMIRATPIECSHRNMVADCTKSLQDRWRE